jgi:NCAIR mutase (PurE)-related protein
MERKSINKIILKSAIILLILTGMSGLTAMVVDQPVHGQVICFGDSITYGAKVDGDSWVRFLQQGNHPGVDFIN